jgi:hypothetical protein
MKRGSRIRLALLLGLVTLATQDAKAGSAVAMGDKAPYLVSSFGYLKRIAEQRALAKCSANGGNCRIIASTEKLGYGAVAVGKGATGGSILGVAIAKSSREEAATLALEHCRAAGGINPRVIVQFRDPPP